MTFTARDHTFVICAYQENPFLEDCIQSVLNQSVLGNVLLSTSTPNNYIMGLAQKYDLPVAMNTGRDRSSDNMNFGYSKAKTSLVTICHQDDYYYPSFLKKTLDAIQTVESPIIAFTDYTEIRNGVTVRSNRLLRVKRIMMMPLKLRALQSNKQIRRAVLSMGNPICCPSVTFNKSVIKDKPFNSKFNNSFDWDAWERLSKLLGNFVYIPCPLMAHRIWNESLTSESIKNGIRTQEDLEIYKRFWPSPIASLLCSVYEQSQKSNNT